MIGQTQNGDYTLVLLSLQGLWFIFMVTLTWAIRRVLKDIEANTKATTRVADSVHSINVLLSGNYTTKSEFDRLEGRLREAENKNTRLETRMETMRGHARFEE